MFWVYQHDVSFSPHLVVDGDPIRPTDAHIDQDQPLGAVQARALNTGVLTPLSPEQIPAHRDTQGAFKLHVSENK